MNGPVRLVGRGIVYGHLGDKPNGRQTMSDKLNGRRPTVDNFWMEDWTRFGELGNMSRVNLVTRVWMINYDPFKKSIGTSKLLTTATLYFDRLGHSSKLADWRMHCFMLSLPILNTETKGNVMFYYMMIAIAQFTTQAFVCYFYTSVLRI